MLRFLSRWIVIFGLAACATRTEAGGTSRAALDQQLAHNAQQHGIAGQAVLILRNGKQVYRGFHGLADREANRPVTPDDIWPAFSVSKLFVTVLIMQLVERGELDLALPIERYVPDLPDSWRKVKVAEALSHISGLPEYFDASQVPFVIPKTREAAFAAAAAKPLQSAPGTTTKYTQTNFLILGLILEARYEQPYRQILTERIIGPLGLKNTYLGADHAPKSRVVKSYVGKNGKLTPDLVYDWREYSVVHGELYTNVEDLGTFLTAVADGRLVKRELLLKLWKPSLGGFASGWDYGTTGRYRHVGHDGGTKVRVRLLFDDTLADTYTFIYLTNGSAANVWSRTLVDSVAKPFGLR